VLYCIKSGENYYYCDEELKVLEILHLQSHLYNFFLHLANSKLNYSGQAKIGDGSVLKTSDFESATLWNSTYAWDFENVWGISSFVNGGLPYLRAFVTINVVTLNVVVNNLVNGGIILYILKENAISQQLYITASQSINLELIGDCELTLLVSKPYVWTLSFEGSGDINGNTYTFSASNETHTISITAVPLGFNNAIII